MDLKLHANATTTARSRAYIQKSTASNGCAGPVNSASTAAPWRAGKPATTSAIAPLVRIGWPPR